MLQIALDFAFPKHDSTPPGATQAAKIQPIAFAVALKLALPELSIGGRESPGWTTWMKVPPTTVDENSQPMGGKHYVRPARQVSPMEPESEAKSMEKRANLQLRLRVTAANVTHDLAAARGRKHVRAALHRGSDFPA